MDKEKTIAKLENMLLEINELTSLHSVRRLEKVFDDYKIILRSLPNEHPFGSVKVYHGSELSDIEFDLERAKKAKPVSKAELFFNEGKGHITDDITDLLREIKSEG